MLTLILTYSHIETWDPNAIFLLFIIYFVFTDSEAMRSGLHKDDYITHINGLNVANSSADNVARIIRSVQYNMNMCLNVFFE